MGDAHGFNSASIRLEADEFREWTPYETVFNNSVRNLVLECIFIGIHLIIGHFFLKFYRRPLEAELPDLKHLHDIHDVVLKNNNRDDQFVYLIAQISCTFGVSIGFCCLSLLPLSVLSNEIKVFCSQDVCPYWWFEWLTADLILEGWSRVSLLTSIFLLIIMPFTFFLIEADGFSWGPPKGIRARLYETVITCLLLLVLVVFFLFVILGLFGRKDIWSSWGIYPVFEVAPLIRTAISFTAILVLLLGLPLGQQELLNKTVDPLLLKPHGSIQAQRDEINLERGYIKRQISRIRPRLRRRSVAAHELIDREKALQAESEKLEGMLNMSRISRFLLRPLYLVLIICSMSLTISACFYRSFQILFDADAKNALAFSATNFGAISLGKNFIFWNISCFELFAATLKFIATIWITISAMRGFYARILPKKILPRKFSTPLHKLILHCILFLVLCSAIPLLCALLAGVPLPINFSGSPVLVGSYYQMFFCIYYSLFSLHSMFKTLSSSKRVEIMFRLNQAWRNSPSSSPRKASHAL